VHGMFQAASLSWSMSNLGINMYPLIMLVSFVKRVNTVCIIKSSWYKLVSTRRSTTLSLLLQYGFPEV